MQIKFVRPKFCSEILDRIENKETFIKNKIFSNESTFHILTEVSQGMKIALNYSCGICFVKLKGTGSSFSTSEKAATFNQIVTTEFGIMALRDSKIMYFVLK